MHRKNGIIRIVRITYSVESNDCTYLDIHDDGGMNQRIDVTYDLQCTNGKLTMAIIIIITDRMSMHCSINM